MLAIAAVPAVAQTPSTAAATPAKPAMTAAQQAAATSALRVANQFIEVLNKGQFDAAMAFTAAQFRQALGSQNLGELLTKAYAQSGVASQRQLLDVEALTPPAEAQLPSGKYMRVIYNTQFAKTGPALESVMLFEEAPGDWKISHYFMRPMPPQAQAAGGDR